MKLGINLDMPRYYTTQQWCDRRPTASALRKMYGTGTIGLNGWPVGPCQVTANYYLDPGENDYVLVITKGTASKIIISQQDASGNPVNRTVQVTGAETPFKATGKENASWAISVVTTDPGETRWALVRADELEMWKADPLAFSPSWISRYKGFSDVRFMDWMKTNDNKTPDYPERDPLENFQAFAGGVPISLIVKFAKQTGIAPWICIPTQASDDTVRSIMKRLESLKGVMTVTVEYANEVWNTDFMAHTYAVSQDKVLLTTNASSLTTGTTPTADGYRWYGYRATQISKIIQDAGWKLGQDFKMALGCQPAQPSKAVSVWDGVKMAGGSGATHFSRWIITGYIWGTLTSDDAVTLPLVRANDLAAGYANLMTVGGMSVAGMPANYAKHKQIATDNGGLEVCWYEGNAHLHTIPHYATTNLVARGVTDLTQDDVQRYFANLHRGAGMADVMAANLKAAEDAGISVACLFNDQGKFGTAGCFGLYGTPGWDAVVKYIADHAIKPPTELDAINAAIAELRAQLDALAVRVQALAA